MIVENDMMFCYQGTPQEIQDDMHKLEKCLASMKTVKHHCMLRELREDIVTATEINYGRTPSEECNYVRTKA